MINKYKQQVQSQQLLSVRLFFSVFFLICSISIPLKANILKRAAKKITKSYNKVKERATKEYETFVAENLHPQETAWNWDLMPKEKIQLPSNFLWGSQPKSKSKTVSTEPEPVVAEIKKKKHNTYYLALDWSAIEPQEGQFNQELLQQHAHFCKKLTQKKIKPIITLFESSMPQWLIDKEGFLAHQNISLYVRYAQAVGTALKGTPAYWIPFLNPNEYARTMYPNDLADLLDCLEHMLIAHRDTYKALKKIIGTDRNSLIGISKHMDPVKAWNTFNPLEQHRAQKLDQALHTAFYNFINNGSMEIYFSEVTKNDFAHSTATSFDFIAITHTGQRYLQSDNSLTYHPNKNSLYAQGIYNAIKNVSLFLTKKTPIVIIGLDTPHPLSPTALTQSQGCQTENIISAIQKAYAEKYPLIGYISA